MAEIATTARILELKRLAEAEDGNLRKAILKVYGLNLDGLVEATGLSRRSIELCLWQTKESPHVRRAIEVALALPMNTLDQILPGP